MRKLLMSLAVVAVATMAQAQSTQVGGGPLGLAFDGTNIWVTNPGDWAIIAAPKIYEVNATTGTVVGAYAVGTEPYWWGSSPQYLAFDGTHIWATNPAPPVGEVIEMQASDGSVVATYPVGGNPSAIVFDGANVWAANVGDQYSPPNYLTRIPVSGGEAVTYPLDTGLGMVQRLTYDDVNHFIYASVASYDADGHGAVLKVDPTNGNVVHVYVIGGEVFDAFGNLLGWGGELSGITFDGQNVWVLTAEISRSRWYLPPLGGYVTKLRVSDGYVQDFFYDVGWLAQSVVVEGGNLWVTSRSSGVTKLKTSNGDVLRRYDVGGEPRDIIFNATGTWVSVDGADGRGYVTKL